MTVEQIDTLFAGSNGQYYTGWEARRKRRRGEWRLCLRQRDPDRLVVETADRSLLFLTRIEPQTLPNWTEIRIEGGTARIVDTRGAILSETRR